MEYKLLQHAEKFNKRHRRRKAWEKVVSVLGCAVVFCTTYALILPAITMERDVFCVIQEHEHTEQCYIQQIETKELICSDETLGVHQHTDDCFAADGEVICGYANYIVHHHGSLCNDETGMLVCTLSEVNTHTHTETCFAVIEEPAPELLEPEVVSEYSEAEVPSECSEPNEAKELICQIQEVVLHEHGVECVQEEGRFNCGYAQILEHVHTESCFKMMTQELTEPLLNCEQPEHVHGLACYSNNTADVENAFVWEDTLPSLSGETGADVVSVALSQLGYRESTSNYIVLEDGTSVKGYTRYGAWKDVPYNDWNTLFACFCLHYAQVDNMPIETECQTWVESLQEASLYNAASEHVPTIGNLVFLDPDNDGIADRVGIIEKICDDILCVIEGDLGNEAARMEYSITEPAVLGYGMVPEREKISHTAVIYTDESYAVLAQDTTVITLTGALPKDAQVRAFPVTIETEKQMLCAYDIAIVLPDGTLYEPVGDESVSVSIQTSELGMENISGSREVEVYYLPEDGEPELVDSMPLEDGICFETDHFSVYMVLLAEEKSSEQVLESIADDPATFLYIDEAEGFRATLNLDSSYYTPSKFDLVVRRMSEANYSNALNTFTKQGQVIEEAAIYKVYLADKTTGQMHTHLACGYTLKMSWANKLFEDVNDSDILNFTYCRNSGSEPTVLNDSEIVFDESGNVTSLSTSDSYYPNSAEFMFVRSSAPNGLVAGQSDLKYNKNKDAFLKDSQYVKYYNANSPIGTAGSFHIVAFEEAHLNTHTNGNVLARDLYASSNFGTNGFSHELSYVQNYVRVHSTSASSTEHILVIGSENKVDFVDNGNAFSINGTKIDKPHHLIQDKDTVKSPFIDLKRVEVEIRQISERLNAMTDANLTYTSAAQLNSDHSKLKLDTASGIGVVHYKATELDEKLGGYVQIDGFDSKSNGAVVVNVDCTGVTEIDMPQARVIIDGVLQGTSEVVEFSAGKVIWNFINAEGVLINTHLTTGMVVAPGATVNIKQNLNGTVVADKVLVNAESHRTDFTGMIEEPDVEVTEREYYITVRKVETGYAGSALPGAVFDLFKWENSTWNKVNAEPLVTSGSGTVTLRYLEKDVAYMLVETEAPDGYVLKNGAFYFWIKTDKNQTHPNRSPAGFSGAALEVGDTLFAANDKSYVLPETGGVGSFPYVLAGWVLLVLTSIIFWYKNKLAERRMQHLPDA